ncbi:hypothetical protein BS639_05235 [Rouxiella silvae]|uniref:Ibestrophin n=1 Tax=Rouxiella silvae TaxID=1646373 RepID=A0ABX3U3Y1_9GAMM|nr:bestrophin family ion channel [Rouxiella silvae]KQN44169.1 hypothetical protein ASE93_16145 [Serratia sp. Leaf50]ORJ22250.1 hypothetical protein BS639_05235 [Rouxiella silvae]
MIVRPHQHWFRRLFVWHGSVLSEILFRLSLNLAMSVVAILCFQWYEALGVKLTLAPFSLLGVAIAIFLGFRNSVSYARFTEARMMWGNLLIVNRSLLRQVKSILPQRPELAQELAALLMAFSYCLKHQLRKTPMDEDLARLLAEHDTQTIANSASPCNQILLLIGQWLGKRRQEGDVSDILFHSIDQNVNQLSAVLAGCERISNTPIPFAYRLIVHRTVYLFCTLLPFALVPDLHYMTPLVSVFISYTFISLDALAEELEDPFGTAPNDLPLNAMCNAIEINLREMNNESNVPQKLLPDKQFQLN